METQQPLNCAQCSLSASCIGSGISSPSFSSDQSANQNRRYFRGEKLVDGTQPEGVFLVRSGLLRISRRVPSGGQVTIDLFSASDMVGYPLIFMLDDPGRVVEVIDPTEVCFVEKAAFLNWIKYSTPSRERMLAWVGNEYRRREEQICSLSFRSVRERTAEAICNLVERFGHKQGDRGCVPSSLTREDIAGMIGTARESVVRQLAEFKIEGCISIEGRKIVINEIAKLKSIAGGTRDYARPHAVV